MVLKQIWINIEDYEIFLAVLGKATIKTGKITHLNESVHLVLEEWAKLKEIDLEKLRKEAKEIK